MSDYKIRFWQEADRQQLVELWKIGFGDSESYIGSFHDYFLTPNACLVAEADGRVVSAMYIIRGLEIVPTRRKPLSAGYTYALATLPEYRGQGIGTAVYKAATAAVLEECEVSLVLPAEESLYPFYQKATDAFVLSYVCETRISAEELAAHKRISGARATAPVYFAMRNSLLSTMPHVHFPEEFYDFLEEQGADFFMLSNEGAVCAEKDGDVCRVLELLDPSQDKLASAACAAYWVKAKEYIIRTPMFAQCPGELRPYMLASMKEKPAWPLPADIWCAFGLE